MGKRDAMKEGNEKVNALFYYFVTGKNRLCFFK